MDMTLCGPNDWPVITQKPPTFINTAVHLLWTLNKHWNNTVTGHGPKQEQQRHEKEVGRGRIWIFWPFTASLYECTICNSSCQTVSEHVWVPWIWNSSIMEVSLKD